MDRDPGLPSAQGLYDPIHENDACGVGFVVHVKGVRSHAIVRQALQASRQSAASRCVRLRGQHRRRRRHSDPDAGQVPAQGGAALGLHAAARGQYGVRRGVPAARPGGARDDRGADRTDRAGGRADACSAGAICRPTIGSSARRPPRSSRTSSRSSSGRPSADGLAFERKLYVIRKRIEHAVDKLPIPSTDQKYFYIPSLSSKTLIYKGMLIADQIETMFPDLVDPDVESALALVHQRFSTNTFPSWPLAHPYRYVAHNGEINTLRGNINWMHAREAMCESDLLGDDLAEDAAGHSRGRQRHGHVRQRARVPGHDGPLAAARRAHDDSGAVGRARDDGRRAEGVLRVPRHDDGAVGRPGVDRVHRRHGHRRRARSQRPAPVALLRDEGRPGRHGVRGRRARHS